MKGCDAMTMMTTRRAMWCGLAAMVLSSGVAMRAADGGPAQSLSGQANSGQANTLVDVVLRSTERYRDPAEAEAQGWGSANSCVSGPEEGAMGVHFIKGSILFDGTIDPQQPEALIYEIKGGRARLVGVEFIVVASEWHARNGAAPPVIMGQQTHLVGSPNRYGLPPFYELHVWAWRQNVKGMFVDWNPAVSCAGFEPEDTPAPTAHVHDRP
jgi:hypothetical protein